MAKKKALLLGDYTNAPWHPLQAIEGDMRTILEANFELTCTEDYNALLPESIRKYDLCISYTDCWRSKATPEQVRGLLSYVSEGGGFLVVHNGISLQNNYELCHMIGAKFTGHPPYRTLEIEVAPDAADHEIMQGITAFSIDDEPYQFDEITHHGKKVLMTYKEEGRDCPSAWVHSYALGKVAYLALGHDKSSFQQPVLRQLIANSAAWASK
jgi:type 1 glutamine amidotransferase